MKATSARQKPIGPSATSMNGRRRPSGVWNVSDHGPTTGDSASANSPSDPRTSAISVPESVNFPRSTCRYVVVVIAYARPNAPRPSDHTAPRRSGARLRPGALVPGSESSGDHLHDGVDGTSDVVGPVGETTEHPAGEDLLERPVDDPRREPRVGVASDVATRLPGFEDPPDPEEDVRAGVDAAADLGAARDLAHEHAAQVRPRRPRP